MGFFDKVTKAVGDAVDKGKKDVDQFMRIQKINGEVSAIEAKVAELKTQTQQNSQEAGQKAIALVRAGSLASPDLQVFVDKLAAIEQQIATEQAAIAAKKGDIERIKAEHDAEHAAAAPAGAVPAAVASASPAVPAAPTTPPAAPAPAAAAPMAPPPLPAAPPPDEVPTAPVVPPLPTASACPQCGKPLTGAAFCTECGAKVS
jgi:hypothetical protein